jgi:hypothetical protein
VKPTDPADAVELGVDALEKSGRTRLRADREEVATATQR